jgi:hypothetical protein
VLRTFPVELIEMGLSYFFQDFDAVAVVLLTAIDAPVAVAGYFAALASTVAGLVAFIAIGLVAFIAIGLVAFIAIGLVASALESFVASLLVLATVSG